MNSLITFLTLLSLSTMWAIEPLTPAAYLTRKTAEYFDTLGMTAPHVVGFVPITGLAKIRWMENHPSFYLVTYNLEAAGKSWEMMDFFAGHEVGHILCHGYFLYIEKEHCADTVAVYLAGYEAVLSGLIELRDTYSPLGETTFTTRVVMLKARKDEFDEE